jgi:CHAD domain-containing protein
MEKVPAIDHVLALLENQLQAMERSEPGVRRGADPEELHRFRVATRRSRALIRASRPLVGDRLDTVDTGLRWLGGVSGPARDLDVLIDHLRDVVSELDPDRAGGAAIVSALEDDRLIAREALLMALGSNRYRTLIGDFRDALATLTASRSDVSLSELAEREVAKLREAYDGLGRHPADAELHAVRIKAKRARYAAQLAALAEGQPLKNLAKAVEGIQELIGAHQDAVVAEERVRALAGRGSLLAAGRIIQLERDRRAEARASLPAAWAKVESAAAEAF